LSSRSVAQTAVPKVEAVYPHDTQAFTEGLLLFEGKFFESTGLTGQSTLRRVAPASGVVEKKIDLDSSLFGEGLARVDRQLIQLTWKNGVAIVYGVDDFTEVTRFDYQGEGWGLCFDGTDLVMTDGSDQLYFRDPTTFAVRRQVTVSQGGVTISNLNELECVGSLVYVNVWQTNIILRVDKSTGEVLTQIDASGLLTAAEAKSADVLNGIAFDPASNHFYLTGKLWPKVFEVSFDFSPGGDADAGGRPEGGAADASAPEASASSDAGADSGAPTSSGDQAARARGCGCRASGQGGARPSIGAMAWIAAAFARRARAARRKS
jgi:MYXO-CTERM domain-containing protein